VPRAVVVAGALAAAALVVAQAGDTPARQEVRNRVEDIQALPAHVFVAVERATPRNHEHTWKRAAVAREADRAGELVPGGVDGDVLFKHAMLIRGA
jgi:hypothetical protein